MADSYKCPSCGNIFENQCAFCPHCGQKMAYVQPANSEPMTAQPISQEIQKVIIVDPPKPGPDPKLVGAIQRTAGSKSNLILSIIMTVVFVCSVFTGELFNLISCIVGIVGIWKIYKMGKNKNNDVSGFVALRNSVNLKILSVILIYLGTFWLCIIVFPWVSIPLGFVSTLVLIVYYVTMRKLLGNANYTFKAKSHRSSSAMYAAVITFIKSLTNLVPGTILVLGSSSILAYIAEKQPDMVDTFQGLNTFGIILIVIGSLLTAADIFAGIVLIKYHNELIRKEEPNQAANQ